MWEVISVENSVCGKSIALIDSKKNVVANDEPYYPAALQLHHALAIQDAMNLVEKLAVCDNTALDLAYFKGMANAILTNLERRY